MEKPPIDAERPSPMYVGGRLFLERERLKLSPASAASLMGITVEALAGWESSRQTTGDKLNLLRHAGADILYIITGDRTPQSPVGPRVEATVVAALARFAASDRRRLLLHLVSEELRWLDRQRE